MSFFNELRRRNVFKVGIAYAVAAWLLLQIVDLVLENINAPDWVMQVFMLGLAVGFPIAIIVAWAFELTPDGVRLEKNVDQSQSINRHTGHQLNRGIIMILSMAVVLLLTDRFRDEIFTRSVGETAKTEAYQLYLQGRHLWRQRNAVSLNQAIQLFSDAVTLDPEFHQAWSNLAVARVNLPDYDRSVSTNESYEHALEAADRALEIHPRSTEALLIRASYAELHCDIADSARLYEKAIAFNPQDPTAHHWSAIMLSITGRTTLALEHIQTARRIDPLISAVISIEAEIYRTIGDYTQAEELFRTASALGIYAGSLYPVGINYLYAGDFEKGSALIKEGWIGEDPTIAAGRQLFLQALMDPEKHAAFEKHIGKANESQPYTTTDNLELLAILGSSYVFEYQSELECAKSSQSLWSESFREQRKTPEFFELMDRAGAVEYWREFGWPDDCASLDQNLAECP